MASQEQELALEQRGQALEREPVLEQERKPQGAPVLELQLEPES